VATKRLLMPSFKAPIVTVEFLRQVKNGWIKLPTVDNLKPMICTFPPTMK
jgi:hypothetical protein